MGAVMAELSKTAKASMVKTEKKREEESVEKAIKELRYELLECGMWPSCERIRKLLLAYDTIVTLDLARMDQIKALEAENAALKSLLDPANQLAPGKVVGQVHDEFVIEEANATAQN